MSGELGGGEVDADLLELKGVGGGGLAEVGAGLGEEGGADPGVVVGELGFEFGEGLLPAGEVELGEEGGEAVEVGLVAGKLGIHFALGGVGHVGLGELL